MSRRQMESRCETSRFIAPAELKGWRFAYNSDHVATIIEDDHATTWGTIFSLQESDEEALDWWENVHQEQYYKIEIPIEPFGQVMTYVATNSQIGEPYDNYHHHILVSATNRQLPSWYLDKEIARWRISGLTSTRDYVNQKGDLNS